MSDKNRVYGIDLGTTYSCIAYVDDSGKATVVPNSEGQTTTPSVVYFEGPGKIVVGRTAKDVAEMYPDKVVSTVKRAMGDADWVFDADGNTYHPQDISSFVLRKLVADAEIATGDKITDVVITCPAYFGVNQKEATRQAGVLAGLNVRYVIPEPTAAALAYGMEQTDEQVVLVYDLGGGTFDITVLEIKRDTITVICTGGDHDLGGKNWDETIAAWFAEQFSLSTNIPADQVIGDPEVWQELMDGAENAKITLSSRESYTQKVRYDTGRASVELTRAKFDELTLGFLERTLSLTEQLLETAREKGYSKIDHLLLVGGSTYMPQVKDAVKAKFPFDIQQYDPNQAIARGAALFGFKCALTDEIKIILAQQTGQTADSVDLEKVSAAELKKAEQAVAQSYGLPATSMDALTHKTIRNVSSKSFGIMVQTDDGLKIKNLIVTNQQVPCTISRVFGTFADNQTGVNLQCFENLSTEGPDGECLDPAAGTEVGSAELSFTRAVPKGSPVEISFSLAEDGLLSVHGKDLTTNCEMDAEFKTASIMTTEELDAAASRNLGMIVE